MLFSETFQDLSKADSLVIAHVRHHIPAKLTINQYATYLGVSTLTLPPSLEASEVHRLLLWGMLGQLNPEMTAQALADDWDDCVEETDFADADAGYTYADKYYNFIEQHILGPFYQAIAEELSKLSVSSIGLSDIHYIASPLANVDLYSFRMVVMENYVDLTLCFQLLKEQSFVSHTNFAEDDIPF